MSTTDLAWYPAYPGDHLRISRGWPLVAHGAFHLLIDAQWDLGALPICTEQLRAIVNATADEWAIAWPYVESHFPIDGAARKNYRLEVLRGEALQHKAARRRGAAKTNEKRWGRRVVSIEGGTR